MELNTTQSKLLAIVALGVGSIFVGLLPACFARKSRKRCPLLLSSLLCFGGGVLLCTSLVHILPEARDNSSTAFKPYTELFFLCGFFLLYLMDEIVHFIYGEGAHSHGTENQDTTTAVENQLRTTRVDQPERRHSVLGRYGACNPNERHSLLVSEGPQYPYNPNYIRTAYSDSALYNAADDPPSQLCHVGHEEPCHSTMPTVSLGLLVALSIHSLLEGLVVGLEGLPTKVLLLLAAVASHKLVVGFCLGMELASSTCTTFCKHFLCILVFACSSMGGIVLGMAIADNPNKLVNTIIPILQALAGGTLLYVTVSEVLPRERARWHKQHLKRNAGLLQLFSVLLGFILMTVFSKYIDKD